MNELASVRLSVLREALREGGDASAPRGEIPDKTLRDEFAMSALDHAGGIYSKMTIAELDRLMGYKNFSKDAAVARLAYSMADAMLAAREN